MFWKATEASIELHFGHVDEGIAAELMVEIYLVEAP